MDSTTYSSPAALAHALKDVAAHLPVPMKLGIIQYDRFEAPDTPVWLLSEPYEVPAHHRAKIGIWPQDDQLFLQWCIEKGVTGAATQNFVAQQQMDASWAWMRWLSTLENGAFARQVTRATEQAGQPLQVQLNIGLATPRRQGHYQGLGGQQEVWQPYKTHLVHQGNTGGKVYNPDLSQSLALSDLGEVLARTPDYEWCWVDFGVGVCLPLGQGTFAPKQIWQQFVLPWVDWL